MRTGQGEQHKDSLTCCILNASQVKKEWRTDVILIFLRHGKYVTRLAGL